MPGAAGGAPAPQIMQLPLGMTDTADDIIDKLEPVSLPVHEFPWLEVSIAAAAALLIVLAVYIYRRRKRPTPVESLEERVRRRLGDLAALPVPDPRGFHAELSGLLMRYAEERLGLRGTRLTSAEVMCEFRRNGVMGAAWQDALAGFLRECDRAKFAPGMDAGWDPTERLARCRALFEELAATAAATPRLASPWEGWSNAAV